MDMNFSTKEYFIRETYKSIRRNGFMSFASISTVAVALMVLGIFLLIFLNTNNLAKHLESQVQVSVYMQDDANKDELADMKVKLEKMEGVVKVTAVTKAEALQRFKERLGDQQKILDSLGGDNPFPNSFDVQVKSPDAIKGITDKISTLPKVETARFGQEVVEHLFHLTKVMRFGGVALVIFLAAGTLFIISNTIRLTVFARRKEVVIMKYVGATDWFIRWPFLLEGMTLGFLGAVIANFFLNISYSALLSTVHKTLVFLPLVPVKPLMNYVTIFMLIIGTAIGALGSYISLRKFLRV
jgi:cell division transport system permease protein